MLLWVPGSIWPACMLCTLDTACVQSVARPKLYAVWRIAPCYGGQEKACLCRYTLDACARAYTEHTHRHAHTQVLCTGTADKHPVGAVMWSVRGVMALCGIGIYVSFNVKFQLLLALTL